MNTGWREGETRQVHICPDIREALSTYTYESMQADASRAFHVTVCLKLPPHPPFLKILEARFIFCHHNRHDLHKNIPSKYIITVITMLFVDIQSILSQSPFRRRDAYTITPSRVHQGIMLAGNYLDINLIELTGEIIHAHSIK